MSLLGVLQSLDILLGSPHGWAQAATAARCGLAQQAMAPLMASAALSGNNLSVICLLVGQQKACMHCALPCKATGMVGKRTMRKLGVWMLPVLA